MPTERTPLTRLQTPRKIPVTVIMMSETTDPQLSDTNSISLIYLVIRESEQLGHRQRAISFFVSGYEKIASYESTCWTSAR